jgi:hypothetical protein
MTAKKFYDWQTSGGTDDVMRLVDCLERLDLSWCETPPHPPPLRTLPPGRSLLYFAA